MDLDHDVYPPVPDSERLIPVGFWIAIGFIITMTCLVSGMCALVANIG